jgi:hypothetical protein
MGFGRRSLLLCSDLMRQLVQPEATVDRLSHWLKDVTQRKGADS